MTLPAQSIDTRVTQLERRVDDIERVIGLATRPPTPANTMSVTEAATYTGWSERQLYRLGIVTRGRVLNTAAEQHRRQR